MSDFHNMVIAKSNDMILKSKGVYSTNAAGDIVPVGYHPEHYGELLANHHPFDIDYHNIDPATGQYSTLTHHPHGHHDTHVPNGRGISGWNHEFGGDEGGNGRVLFPVEAVVKGIHDFIEKKGFAQSTDGLPLVGRSDHGIPFSYHLAMEAVQEAIELFNEQRNPDDRLPPLYDENGTRPEWLSTVMGAFPKDEEKREGHRVLPSDRMPIRDAMGRLITFYMNSGTTKGEPERGPYPESGAVPFYKELKEVLNRRLGRGMSMDFVHQPYIEPHMMNPMMSREGSTEGQRGMRTLTPAQERERAQNSHYGEIAPELTIPHHPDAFFRIPIRGGRPSQKTIDMLKTENALLGLGLNENQLFDLARAPISALLTDGKKVGLSSAYTRTYDVLGQATGIHPGRAKSPAQWRKTQPMGMGDDLDALYQEYKQDPTMWELKPGEHSHVWDKHHGHAQRYTGGAYGQGKMARAQASLALFGGAHEMGHDLNQVWNQHSGEPLHAGTPSHLTSQEIRRIYHQIAEGRIARSEGLQGLNQIDFERGHPEDAYPRPTLPQNWRSVPSQAVMDSHAVVQPPAPAPPEPPADPAQRSLFSFSDGLGEAETRLLEAMESIQKKEASRNPEVLKMLPHRTMNRENYDDLMVMANKFHLTPQDIFSITEVRGDWLNVAKALSVSPTVVSTVKVAFGGIE